MITYSEYLKSMIIPEASVGKPIEFPKVMAEIFKISEEQLRNDIKAYLEEIDLKFTNSVSNIQNQGHLSLWQEITIIRTIYEDRLTNKYKM